MKTRKMLAGISALMLSASVCAVSVPVRAEDSKSMYADILNMYYNLISSGGAENSLEYDCGGNYTEGHTSYGYAHVESASIQSTSNYGSDLSSYGYQFIDLNQDGIDELIIGAETGIENEVLDLYTFYNNSPVHVATSGIREIFYIGQDYEICHNWLSSDCTGWQYSQLDGGALKVTEYILAYNTYNTADGTVTDLSENESHFYGQHEFNDRPSDDDICTVQKYSETKNSHSILELHLTPFSEYKNEPEETTAPQPESSASDGWRAAYRQTLDNYINIYNDAVTMYDMQDLNRDGIPELLISQGDEHFYHRVNLYAYDGKEYNLVPDIYDEGETGSYGVLKYNPDTGVILSAVITSAVGDSYTYYKFDGKNLNSLDHFVLDGVDHETGEEIIKRNGTAISEEEYNQARAEYGDEYNEPWIEIGRKYYLSDTPDLSEFEQPSTTTQTQATTTTTKTTTTTTKTTTATAKTTTTTTKTTTPSTDAEWLAVYSKTLLDFKNSEEYSNESRWTLLDIDGDNIKELLIVPNQDEHTGTHLYAYKNNQVVDIGIFDNPFSYNLENHIILSSYTRWNGDGEETFYQYTNGEAKKLDSFAAYTDNEPPTWYVNEKSVTEQEYKAAIAPYENMDWTTVTASNDFSNITASSTTSTTSTAASSTTSSTTTSTKGNTVTTSGSPQTSDKLPAAAGLTALATLAAGVFSRRKNK